MFSSVALLSPDFYLVISYMKFLSVSQTVMLTCFLTLHDTRYINGLIHRLKHSRSSSWYSFHPESLALGPRLAKILQMSRHFLSCYDCLHPSLLFILGYSLDFWAWLWMICVYSARRASVRLSEEVCWGPGFVQDTQVWTAMSWWSSLSAESGLFL